MYKDFISLIDRKTSVREWVSKKPRYRDTSYLKISIAKAFCAIVEKKECQTDSNRQKQWRKEAIEKRSKREKKQRDIKAFSKL